MYCILKSWYNQYGCWSYTINNADDDDDSDDEYSYGNAYSGSDEDEYTSYGGARYYVDDDSDDSNVHAANLMRMMLQAQFMNRLFS